LGLILGDDHFAERALQAAESGLSRMPKLQEIFEVLCKEYKVDISVLYEQGENYRHSEFRAMAAFVVQRIEGLTLTSLASELGRDLSALSQSAGRLHKQMKEDPELRERVNKVMSLILVS